MELKSDDERETMNAESRNYFSLNCRSFIVPRCAFIVALNGGV
jgi:hypothetical protein